jgi:integrase
MKASQLKPRHLMAAYSERLKSGPKGRIVSAKTVRHAHELLRNILNRGVRHEALSRNNAALVGDDDLPKAVKAKPLALTEGEVRKLLTEAKTPTSRATKRGYLSSQPWFHPAVAFSVYTGARRGEVLALRWSDVSFEKKSVTIARSLTESMAFKAPKRDRTRTLAMSDDLCGILMRSRRRLILRREYCAVVLIVEQNPCDELGAIMGVRCLIATLTAVTSRVGSSGRSNCGGLAIG